MGKIKNLGLVVSGICAGAINGLFGAGGGMVLIPLLTYLTDLDENDIFPASVCIIAPLCVVSFALTVKGNTVAWHIALPYLLASSVGGILAGMFGRKIPTIWLHRILGILILWGGVRYLC
ncbi:MAG: sulfite exporter TauE/SafE family protein [Oscillospiraceae bacterium]|nr:sulfite exporter TauE/SafE family protein [Oscillospiraceae bacterium]